MAVKKRLQLEQLERDEIEREAVARHERHLNHPTHRPLSDGYELIGLLGEKEFVTKFGGKVDLVARPGGDKGRDAYITIANTRVPVDVKTARKAFNLIVEVGKVKPQTIYVLAQFFAEDHIDLLGWEWGALILKAPTRDFGYGVINHFIHKDELCPMRELYLAVGIPDLDASSR